MGAGFEVNIGGPVQSVCDCRFPCIQKTRVQEIDIYTVPLAPTSVCPHCWESTPPIDIQEIVTPTSSSGCSHGRDSEWFLLGLANRDGTFVVRYIGERESSFLCACVPRKVSMFASSGHIRVFRVQSLLFLFGLRPFGLKSVGTVWGRVGFGCG